MAHHNSDLSQQADSRRRLLAADPFPPLAPPTLDAATAGSAEFDVTVPWPAAELEPLPTGQAGADAHGLGTSRPAPDPFAAAPLPFAAAPLPSAGTPYAAAYPAAGAFPSSPPNGAANGYAAPADLDRLRAENEEMHKLIEEMKHIFEQASAQEDENGRDMTKLRERTAELERQGQEKDEQMQMLTLQIHELEQHIQEAPAALPTEDELSKMADEVEKERCKVTQDRRTLDQERQQLREDEEALEKQMREMEVQMAKERAEMARQRTELQRLHGEVRHELDQLQRGGGALKDRLAQFHRRHQEVFSRPGAVPVQAAPVPEEEAAVAQPVAASGDNGLMRRLFGRK